jgi:hypothetical protein
VTPARGLLLVRPVQTAETLGAGRIALLEETRQRWSGMQCEVLAVGAEEYCEDDYCERDHAGWVHPCTIAEGDWLLVRPRCFVPTDVEDLWLCKQSDALARLTLESPAA